LPLRHRDVFVQRLADDFDSENGERTVTTRTEVAVASSPGSARLASLDILRGPVMVLMAIDHVLVYSGVPAGGPTAGVFFTRWVTHFCAPVFVFLAGPGACLYGPKGAARRTLSRYLRTRGLVLVVLELTVVRLAWTFTPASLRAP